MGRVLLVRVVVVLLLSFGAGAARAGTMTFDALPAATPDPYHEDGITAIGDRDLGWHTTAGRAHLDDSGTPFARSITFSMAGRFGPVSFEIFSLGSEYCPPGSSGPPCDTPYDTVRVAAFRDGEEVYTDLFSAGPAGTFSSYLFPALAPVDWLTIRALRPDNADGEEGPTPEQGYCGGPPCSQFDIDNVTLELPEPAFGARAALAAAALGLRLWRRSRPRAASSRPA